MACYDELDNAERVSEEMHRLREGVDLGWPYTYRDPIKKARRLAPEHGGDNRIRVEDTKYAFPVVAFPAHWAPLQMAICTGDQFPGKYRHGAWNRAPLPQAGCNVAFAPFDARGNPLGTHEVFVRSDPGTGRTRLSGAAAGPHGSLYIGESGRGRIWRIFHIGETARAGSAVVTGDPERLMRVILKGPVVAFPADRAKYSNLMPACAHLRDAAVANLATCLRQASGENASAITPGAVAAARTR